MAHGKSRGSARLKESERIRIIDDSSRKRLMRKFHELLEADNHHEDPYADLVMSKKAPKFDDSFEARPRKKKERTAEQYQIKYRKTLLQNIEDDKKEAATSKRPSYANIAAPPCKYPPFHLCAVCGYQSIYNCISCGVRLCHSKCFEMHFETRCMKWMG